jgi:guanylate kinase
MEKILGLVGPSGVGKGYSKHAINEAFPNKFAEPVVVTTRPKRSADGIDRLAGLQVEEFHDLVRAGEVLFPHQPFGNVAHWYGFLARSFQVDKPILTEVHAGMIDAFKGQFAERLALLALIADNSYLKRNLQDRGSESPDSLALRLIVAVSEIRTIIEKYEQGKLDHIIQVSQENRPILKQLVKRPFS